MSHAFASRIAKWWQQPVNRVIALLLPLYAIALGLHMQAYGSAADPAGYLNNARLLGKGMVSAAQTVIPGLDANKFQPMTFVPSTFRPVGGGRMIPIYPAGLPLAVLSVARITGWDAAPPVTMLVMAILGILATAWLGVEMGLPRTWAWFAALLLAASPLYILMSLQLMSDVPALVCVTTAVALAWKSRARDAWALLSGIMVAYAVFVRPTNLLVMVPVGVCLGFAWRRWLFLALAGAPGAILWCLCNHAATGHFLETGYGNLTGRFTWSAVPATWLFYVRWLPVLFTPVALFALGLPWLLRRSVHPALMLIVWIFAFFAFYSTDTDTVTSWGCLRYLLPALPACLVGALLVLRRLLQAPGAARITTPFVAKISPALSVTAVIVFGIACVLRLHLGKLVKFGAVFPSAVHWAQTHIPDNAVVMGHGMTATFYCYTPCTLVRMDQLNPEQWSEIVKACAAIHRPVYAVIYYPYDMEPLDEKQAQTKDWTTNVGEYLEKQFPGNWKQAGRVDTASFWKLDMEGSVQDQP